MTPIRARSSEAGERTECAEPNRQWAASPQARPGGSIEAVRRRRDQHRNLQRRTGLRWRPAATEMQIFTKEGKFVKEFVRSIPDIAPGIRSGMGDDVFARPKAEIPVRLRRHQREDLDSQPRGWQGDSARSAKRDTRPARSISSSAWLSTQRATCRPEVGGASCAGFRRKTCCR